MRRVREWRVNELEHSRFLCCRLVFVLHRYQSWLMRQVLLTLSSLAMWFVQCDSIRFNKWMHMCFYALSVGTKWKGKATQKILGLVSSLYRLCVSLMPESIFIHIVNIAMDILYHSKPMWIVSIEMRNTTRAMRYEEKNPKRYKAHNNIIKINLF